MPSFCGDEARRGEGRCISALLSQSVVGCDRGSLQDAGESDRWGHSSTPAQHLGNLNQCLA